MTDSKLKSSDPKTKSVAQQQCYSDTPKEQVASKIVIDPHLTRKIVSYQGNKTKPGFRWFKYKEGFSTHLVESLLSMTGGDDVLDPFSGSGTTVLTACKMGMQSTGIDVIPVGNIASDAISTVSNDLTAKEIIDAADIVLGNRTGVKPFQHVNITRMAFPRGTERALSHARYAIDTIKNKNVQKVMNFACMSILEDISYTRKDGQFLRWDHRSGRDVVKKLNKGDLPSFRNAFKQKINDILSDMPSLKSEYTGIRPVIKTKSCLEALKEMPTGSIDTVVTSPPYANRYDYTRTYALELAYLGYDQSGFSALRQAMLTATVENRPKADLITDVYGSARLATEAYRMAGENKKLQNVLRILKRHKKNLNNTNIIRLVENYFVEMAIVISELGRIVRRGGNVFMVNDNVRYHGVGVPVDVILSEFAEHAGFSCDSIRVLPRGKGNSSQQMGKFGRNEMRKCVYRWQK